VRRLAFVGLFASIAFPHLNAQDRVLVEPNVVSSRQRVPDQVLYRLFLFYVRAAQKHDQMPVVAQAA
jgi:hypothetical protein